MEGRRCARLDSGDVSHPACTSLYLSLEECVEGSSYARLDSGDMSHPIHQYISV
jgi:hypothetical protein